MTEKESISFRERVEGSAWSLWMKPVCDYVVRVAEVLALAAVFHAAADRTDSITIEVFAFALSFIAAGYAGLPIGFALIGADRIRTKKLWLALLVALPGGILFAYLAHAGGKQVSEMIDEFVAIQVDD